MATELPVEAPPMIHLPWKHVATAASGRPVVSATELRLRRYRDIPELMRAALRLRRSHAEADGAVAMALAASPLRRTFWTLSTWSDGDALAGYVRSDQHREVMRAFAGRLEHATSARWPLDEAPPDWPTALTRLERQRSRLTERSSAGPAATGRG